MCKSKAFNELIYRMSVCPPSVCPEPAYCLTSLLNSSMLKQCPHLEVTDITDRSGGVLKSWVLAGEVDSCFLLLYA